MASAGQVLGGRYRLEEQVDQGAVGPLFRATRADDGASVSVRVAAAVAEGGEGAGAAAVESARVAMGLQGPCTARLLDVGQTEDGIPFLVYEPIEGWRVSTLLDKTGPVPAEHAASVVDGVLQSLEQAEGQGLAHGWLGPSSVYVGEHPDGSDRITVLDYGLPQQGAAPPGAHLAPERERGDPATPASDVLSVGLLLADLLTGSAVGRRRPEGDPVAGAPLPPQVKDSALAEVVQQAVPADPGQRFGSATAMRRALQAALGADPTAQASPVAGHAAAAGAPAAGAAAEGPGDEPADSAPTTAMPATTAADVQGDAAPTAAMPAQQASGETAPTAEMPAQTPKTAPMPKHPGMQGPAAGASAAAPAREVPAQVERGSEQKGGGCRAFAIVAVVVLVVVGGAAAAWMIVGGGGLIPDWSTGAAQEPAAPTSTGTQDEGTAEGAADEAGAAGAAEPVEPDRPAEPEQAGARGGGSAPAAGRRPPRDRDDEGAEAAQAGDGAGTSEGAAEGDATSDAQGDATSDEQPTGATAEDDGAAAGGSGDGTETAEGSGASGEGQTTGAEAGTDPGASEGDTGASGGSDSGGQGGGSDSGGSDTGGGDTGGAAEPAGGSPAPAAGDDGSEAG